MASRQSSARSTGELVRDLVADMRMLARQEFALARAEVREETRQIAAAVALLAAAAAAAALAGIWLLVATTRALAAMFLWPLAAAYALVGAVLALTAAICGLVAWHQLRRIRLLPLTRETLAAHVRWTPAATAGHE
jgi:hypothetical protein